LHAGDQARNLAKLLSNRKDVLGEKMYTTMGPIMGLPWSRQAQRLRVMECSSFVYMPGIMIGHFNRLHSNASLIKIAWMVLG